MNIMVQHKSHGNRLYHTDVECIESTQPGRIAFSPKEEPQKLILEQLVKPGQTVRFEASWTHVALNFDPVPALPEGRRLVFRVQTTSDQVPLQQMVPFDQAKLFEASWVDGKLLFILPAGGDIEANPLNVEKARLKALSINALKTESAERGVKWDGNVSADTMITRIAEEALKVKA